MKLYVAQHKITSKIYKSRQGSKAWFRNPGHILSSMRQRKINPDDYLLITFNCKIESYSWLVDKEIKE